MIFAALVNVIADLPVSQRDSDRVAGAVHRVLSRPEYQQPAKPWLTRVRDAILDWLARVLSSIAGAGFVAWIMLAVVLALVALVAVRLFREVSRDPASGVTVRAARIRPAADWRAEAEVHERAGEWRQALRCRYRALVADLAGRGLLEEVPGRTAGEYRSALGESLPAASPSFRGATELFEGAWYGRRPTDAQDSARFQQLADSVLSATR
jgi:hypothetical protein